MKFGIIVSKDIKKAQELAESIKEFLDIKGQKILEERDLKGADAIITLGGDGTLIHTACEYVEFGIPFVGINVGTLGFLTAAERSEWKEAVDKIIKGDYVISERMTIEASIIENLKLKIENYRALNEIVVKGMYRVIDLEVVVNGQKFLDISGDGVIVSTPTGSTAYSLSAGGPIVDSELDSLLVTPINAVGLPIPSVALSAEDLVEVKVVGGDDVSLIIDGQEHAKVTKGQTIKVSRGKYRVKFVYFDKHHFLKALNAKFGLGGRVVG